MGRVCVQFVKGHSWQYCTVHNRLRHRRWFHRCTATALWRLRHAGSVWRRRRFPQTTKLNHSASDHESVVVLVDHPETGSDTERQTQKHHYQRKQNCPVMTTINARDAAAAARRWNTLHKQPAMRCDASLLVILRSILHVRRTAWRGSCSHKKPRLELHWHTGQWRFSRRFCLSVTLFTILYVAGQ